jgi:hypothetical protein
VNFAPLEKIANAVLYEGLLLYPYRPSAVKNQQRWRFGTLGPPGGSEPNEMQTECLIETSGEAEIDLKIRFLQDDIERELNFSQVSSRAAPQTIPFSFPPLEGHIEIDAAQVGPQLMRFRVRILNLGSETKRGSSMLSTHTLLAVQNGEFISLLDPPERYRAAAAVCRNVGTWPVLAGSEGDRHMIISSPIILYDYPQIAPESHGDFFDCTEIDEMLTLRVLTLTDEEKREVRAGTERGRQILECTETLPPEQVAKLHGAIRGLRNVSKLGFRAGDRVRLRPRQKTDVFDIALEGKMAVIESVECDLENRVHLAVTVDDDPGRDLGVAHQIGHRFFFSPEDVELV